MCDVVADNEAGSGSLAPSLQHALHVITCCVADMLFKHCDQLADRFSVCFRSDAFGINTIKKPDGAFKVLFDVRGKDDNRCQLRGDDLIQAQRSFELFGSAKCLLHEALPCCLTGVSWSARGDGPFVLTSSFGRKLGQVCGC